ncbi:heterochromatin protein 1 isoform X1 [Drosophila willistoni]|uniref:heterochromatin protein 1 isoform X1 n=1 Tax=Drosophila willistoni TaxID=7260 RepID=UPI001F080EFF|nr:heterochromatin protein 1 isoform X1 [Drosophila willistoni]
MNFEAETRVENKVKSTNFFGMSQMWKNTDDTSDEDGAGAEVPIFDELVRTCQELNKKKRKASDDSDSSSMEEGAVGGDFEVEANDQSSAGNGFDRGLEVEKIMSVHDGIDGKRIYVTKFRGAEELQHIPSAVASAKMPQIVINFYLERIQMLEDDDE